MSSISIENLSKTYPIGFQAVQSLNLDVAEGEFMVLVGPSGCGKTTALRMVAGLEEITGGTLKIGERVANHLSSKERDVAMVFQNYALYPHMTVGENIARPPRRRSVARSPRPRPSSDCRTCSSASPACSRAASASAWPWAGPSCATRPSS